MQYKISVELVHSCPSSKNFEQLFILPLYLSYEIPVISEAVETDGDRLRDGAHAFLESLTLCGQPHGLSRPSQRVDVVSLLELGREVSHQTLIKQPPTNGGIEIF